MLIHIWPNGIPRYINGRKQLHVLFLADIRNNLNAFSIAVNSSTNAGDGATFEELEVFWTVDYGNSLTALVWFSIVDVNEDGILDEDEWLLSYLDLKIRKQCISWGMLIFLWVVLKHLLQDTFLETTLIVFRVICFSHRLPRTGATTL